jgi:hypothetical protein
MELRMSDDPLSRLPSFSRVSIQAILVKEGEDPSAALAEAGLVNPVAIPVLLGDEPHLSGGILGDGITPNLTAFLESAYPDDRDASPHSQPAKAAARAKATLPAGPVTSALPPAFGSRPFAPVGNLSNTGQRLEPRSGIYGDRTSHFPPTPSSFVQGATLKGRRRHTSSGMDRSNGVGRNELTTWGNPTAAGQGVTDEGVVAQPANSRSGPGSEFSDR